MPSRPQPMNYSSNVAQRVRELRRQRSWSAQHLSDLLTAAGCPITRSVIATIETTGRHITVDELYAFARVFSVPVDTLAHDHAVCPSCTDQPPAGFTCNACGKGRS